MRRYKSGVLAFANKSLMRPIQNEIQGDLDRQVTMMHSILYLKGLKVSELSNLNSCQAAE